MGKLIVIAGNTGVGKTTLCRALSAARPFAVGLEEHVERPFQALMAADPARYALANQVDYLLLRAEQERALRADPRPGLVDGGLDLDFHGFTRLFHERGYLDDAGYALCARLYDTLRALLGPPDIILYLTAPLDVVAARYAARGRALEIARRDDLARLDAYVAEWIAGVIDTPVIHVDAGADDTCGPEAIARLLRRVTGSR